MYARLYQRSYIFLFSRQLEVGCSVQHKQPEVGTFTSRSRKGQPRAQSPLTKWRMPYITYVRSRKGRQRAQSPRKTWGMPCITCAFNSVVSPRAPGNAPLEERLEEKRQGAVNSYHDTLFFHEQTTTSSRSATRPIIRLAHYKYIQRKCSGARGCI